MAKKHGVQLRQSYSRIAKHAAMMAGRYAHAKQFNRYRRQLRILRTRLGRLIRDIRRKISGQEHIAAAFEAPLARASQIRSQQQRQRGWKLYSFHAPETECIGKGKASAPYEFGVKASIVTTNARAPGGQFVLHTKALPGNPYDGHTLRESSRTPRSSLAERSSAPMSTKDTADTIAPNPRRVFISGQKRGVFGVIKRELRRRSVIEPVIGHMKSEGHLGRSYPQRPRRRCRQRHPYRCRLQLPTHPRMAEGSLAPNPDRNIARLHHSISAQSGLLTDDLLGIAYKKNVADVRESPSFKFLSLLEQRGTKVDFHDPHVTTIPSTREHAEFAGRTSVELSATALELYDVILVVTDHDAVDYALIARNARLVIDTRNVFARKGIRGNQILKTEHPHIDYAYAT